ncbi:MAG TPA: energy transducer TonB [Candidatus Acidoferrum sp.]|nr:energy transducer TonB [Candidatus Acidoferrum sp.]
MKILASIWLITILGMRFASPQNTREYLQRLVGQRLILRHYAGTSNPRAKEKDLISKRGGCDEAVEVMNVAFKDSSLQLQLRNIGSPTVRQKNIACSTLPDVYSFKVTDFDFDQPRDDAENAIEHLLQTPEAYLAAYGIAWDLPPSSENGSPVDFPYPGLRPPEVLLSVQPYYSEENRKVRIQGTVDIKCVIGTDGLIHAPVIERGLTKELNQLALEAMTFWRLRPVSDGSRAVAARVPVQISFRIL